MENIKTFAYAGLGLAMQTNQKVKTQFNELVELGKKSDMEGKNIVGDFFKTIESTKEDIENQIIENKNKIYDTIPVLKEIEDKFNERSEEVKSAIKDTYNKMKTNFQTNTDENTETTKTDNAEVVEENK